MLWTQSAGPTSWLPFSVTGRMVPCAGHLFDWQGRWDLRESALVTSQNRQFHISTTSFWPDLTLMLPKACLLTMTRSHSFLGLVAKVYSNSMLNGRTQTSTSHYMLSWICPWCLQGQPGVARPSKARTKNIGRAEHWESWRKHVDRSDGSGRESWRNKGAGQITWFNELNQPAKSKAQFLVVSGLNT